MRRLLWVLTTVAFLVAASGAALTWQDQGKDDPKAVHFTGCQVPPDIQKRVSASWGRHKAKLESLPTVTAATYDCRALGWVPPIKDQGSCGSCWDFSGMSIIESAYIKAGVFKVDFGGFSEQYILDCTSNGGCNGDWQETVLEAAKQKGVPTVAEYGPYQARTNRCKATNPKFYPIADFGYVGSQSGVPPAQAIKDAMVRYGPISVAVAADNRFMGYSGGVFKGSSRDINHAVTLVGWDDAKKAWLMRNSWGKDWGVEGGYMWIEYGANQIGYGALWCSVTALPPPPDPPTPPDPPLPPGPAGRELLTITRDGKIVYQRELFPMGTSDRKLGDLIVPMQP